MAKRSRVKRNHWKDDPEEVKTEANVQEAETKELSTAPAAENTDPADLKEPNAEPSEGEAKAEAEVEAEVEKPNSVVAPKFKELYLRNAKEAGLAGKAAKRSNWDWLSQTIASVCLKEKEKIDINEFTALLEANGVDHLRWTNRNKGWEGRFRMTGRVALQKIVAANGVLKLPDGNTVTAPANWVAKYKKSEAE